MTDAFYWIGVCVSGVVVIAAVVELSIAAFVYLYSPLGPMLHCGKFKLECRLIFYTRKRILSRKGDGRISSEEAAHLPPEIDHYFNVPWFVGVSTRKGHFLFGLLRLRRNP